ncbi:MAG TPA: hypothetical protein VE397_01800 [Stellaceae bacterium]|jgi:hypothetical protein|nr:hypothetical protein [Stellaceae bacterium]
MSRLRPGLLTAAALTLSLAIAGTASAQRDGGGWHDHDIHHFNDHDFGAWRGGHWYHGGHNGQTGWWWMVGPNWYYYPRAVYPYPDPYVPPYAAPGAPAWYYCPPMQGYYPYVASCPVPWQVVPAR